MRTISKFCESSVDGIRVKLDASNLIGVVGLIRHFYQGQVLEIIVEIELRRHKS